MQTSAHVLFMHGVWLPGASMVYLANHFKQNGFTVEFVNYPSVSGGTDIGLRKVRRAISKSPFERVHIVAHSLGSLLAYEALSQLQRWGTPAQGNMVAIGPPFLGSAVARKIIQTPGFAFTLSKTKDILAHGVTVNPLQGINIGVIAGTKHVGWNMFFPCFNKDIIHDGTVSLEESTLTEAKDFLLVKRGHIGMLFSKRVAEQAVHFILNNKFEH